MMVVHRREARLMRRTFAVAVVAIGIGGTALASAALAGADDESATDVISRLQSQGYKVTIDKIGTAPIDQCTVTSVRNPQQFSQLVPYPGPGLGGDRILVPQVTSQTVSVSLSCPR
jgi:hypothetical protein